MPTKTIDTWQKRTSQQHFPAGEQTTYMVNPPDEIELTDAHLAFVCGGHYQQDFGTLFIQSLYVPTGIVYRSMGRQGIVLLPL